MFQAPSVIDQMESQVVKTQSENSENRIQLLKQLSSLQFLLQQGLATHGHMEADGTVDGIMKWRFSWSKEMVGWS